MQPTAQAVGNVRNVSAPSGCKRSSLRLGVRGNVALDHAPKGATTNTVVIQISVIFMRAETTC
jgi:hypothetical protein